AAASDRADDDIVHAIVAAGADVRPLDHEEASAATWAARRGDPTVIAAIKPPDAAQRPDLFSMSKGTRVGADNTVHAALVRAAPILQSAGPGFRAASGCPSCHHDALPLIAIARVKAVGIPIDDAARVAEARAVADSLRPGRENYLQGYAIPD